MDEKLYEDIKSVVAKIFSEKEESEKVAQTEEALREAADTIADLTTTLEKRNEELKVYETEATELKEQVSTFESELEAAQEEKKELETKMAEVEASLEDIKKDRLSEKRMAELEEAGVKIADDEAQTAKVREMSDEEFVSYKSELVSIRESVVAELAKNKESSTDDNAEDSGKTASTKAADEKASDGDDDGGDPPPANIDKTKAVTAALNFEGRPSDDMIAKYAELGKALAEEMKKSK